MNLQPTNLRLRPHLLLLLAVSGFAMIPQTGNPDSWFGTWVARSIFLPGTLVIIAAVVPRYVDFK